VSGAAEQVQEILSRGGDADDVLREVVSTLAETPGVSWAGIAFVEDGALRLGPAAGREDERRRMRAAVSFQGSTVGELWLDGAVGVDDLDRVASLIASLVLIGWDTGGEAWEP
jgi:putative methionine-R-sulfoxide reductase with GAF domain